jgi:hypothetical protein
MQEHRARCCLSLAPIALGHALSIGVVVLIVQLAQVALPMLHLAMLRRSWFNLDLIWATALVVTGLVALLI